MTRARTLLAWLFFANALDLSTSLDLHGADEFPLPERPAWLRMVQLALLPGLLYSAKLAWPWLRRSWARVQAPLGIKLLIAAVLSVQLLHVFFRTEHYPFSAVTMFSNYIPGEPEPLRRHDMFVVDTPAGPRAVSFLREGSPWFSEYLSIDYKGGWILGTFGRQDHESRRRVAALLVEGGAQNPRFATVELDARSGELRVLTSEAP